MLSTRLLEQLRGYYKRYQPKTYLFPSSFKTRKDRPLPPKAGSYPLPSRQDRCKGRVCALRGVETRPNAVMTEPVLLT